MRSISSILGFDKVLLGPGTYYSTKTIVLNTVGLIKFHCDLANSFINENGEESNILFTVINNIPNGKRMWRWCKIMIC